MLASIWWYVYFRVVLFSIWLHVSVSVYCWIAFGDTRFPRALLVNTWLQLMHSCCVLYYLAHSQNCTFRRSRTYTDTSSCACIALLFETSSSSHVLYHIARQRGPLGPETVIWPCLTSSDHEICHICIKCTNLDPPKSFSYWFSGWPHCNPLMQTDNILCETRRGPKRIDQSWDIDDKPAAIPT